MQPITPQQEAGIDWRACLLCCGANLICVTAFILLTFIVPGLTNPQQQEPPLAAFFTLAVLICPVLETCVFFWAPYRLLTWAFKQPALKWVFFFLLTISAFTLAHYSSKQGIYSRSLGQTFITGTVGGACYATGYYLTKRKGKGKGKGNRNAFLTTATCHLLYNSIIFVCSAVLQQTDL